MDAAVAALLGSLVGATVPAGTALLSLRADDRKSRRQLLFDEKLKAYTRMDEFLRSEADRLDSPHSKAPLWPDPDEEPIAGLPILADADSYAALDEAIRIRRQLQLQFMETVRLMQEQGAKFPSLPSTVEFRKAIRDFEKAAARDLGVGT